MKQFRDLWLQRREERRLIAAAGRVIIESPWVTRGRLQVTCPPSAVFSAGAAELSGRWRSKSGVWSFPPRSVRLVVMLCKKVYGAKAIELVGFPPDGPDSYPGAPDNV